MFVLQMTNTHFNLRDRLRRLLIVYLVIPVGWSILFFAAGAMAYSLWACLSVGYLILLFAMTFTTAFAEDRFAGKLTVCRKVLSIGGPLALGGLLSGLYLVIFILIAEGPDYFE